MIDIQERLLIYLIVKILGGDALPIFLMVFEHLLLLKALLHMLLNIIHTLCNSQDLEDFPFNF